MEIKILCNCGTKYKFDVEPINGRVPFEVKCPTCGVSGNNSADDQIQQLLGAAALAESAATPVVSATQESKLRVRVHVPTPADSSIRTSHESATPAAPAPRFFAPPQVTAYAPPDEGLSPKFFLGLLGGVLGVLLGCGIWYLIFHFTGAHIRLLAIIVGAAGGFGAKLLSKDEGSSQLGMITAVVTFVGIVFTAYFIGRERAHSFLGVGDIYKDQVAYAKRAVKAVPNGSEQEIRSFLAKEESSDGEKVDPATINATEIRLFGDVRLGHYKELASGQIHETNYFKVERHWEHDEEVAKAKYALAAIPNESDSEIRAHLAEEYAADSGEKVDPKTITAEQIQQFRTEELPELKKLASGEKQFVENSESDATGDEALTKVEEENAWMKFMYFFVGWGFGGIGIMVITLGLAYKICTHA